MSPRMLGAAAALLWASASANAALAADQEGGGSGAGAPTAQPGRITLPEAPPAWSGTAAYSPGATLPSTLASDARLMATGASDGQQATSSGYLQVSGWSSGRWSFASIMAVPDVAPSALSGNVPVAWDHERWDGPGDTFDVAVTPLVASYGITPNNHIALSVGMNVPTNTGRYRRMLAASSTLWTVMPKLAYTQELTSSDRDSSTVVAVGTFSRTAVSGFQGTVGRVEAMVMQRNSSGWGYGGVAAAIQQPDSAQTSMANRMYGTDSNTGMSLGVGPQISWSSHWLGSGVQFQYRWIYEFRAPNGHSDQPMLLSATVHL